MEKKASSDVVYHVDQWKGIVVARWAYPYMVAQEFVEETIERIGWDFDYERRGKFMFDPISVSALNMRGIARCMPDDEFNLETGKRIALKKLRHKLRAAKKRVLSKLTYEFLKSAIKCTEMVDGEQKVVKPFVLTYAVNSKGETGAVIEVGRDVDINE